MNVFFYGLFMDTQLLAAKGIVPASVQAGFADGYALRIGERATLIREQGARAYGVVMDIAADDTAQLYAEPSVADYESESIRVELTNGDCVDAACYLLPADRLTGTNSDYAKSLLRLAARLEFPESYRDEIARQGLRP